MNIEKQALSLLMNVTVKKLHEAAIIPQRGTELASGFDLHALDVVHVDDLERVPPDYYSDAIVFYDGITVWPGERVLIKTGIAVQMDRNMEAQVRPRSGLSLKKGIHVALGTIDADYTGDIGVTLTNNGNEEFRIHRGDRVAQLVFVPVLHDVQLNEVDELNETKRGVNGYGHTGTSQEVNTK